MIRNKFHTVIRSVVLLVTSGLLLYSCSKEPTGEQVSSTDSQKVQEVKEHFYSEKIDKQLTQKLNDSLTIFWEPDWQAASTSKNDKEESLYIPLRPRSSNKKGQGKVVASVIQYLLVRKSPKGESYNIATYIPERGSKSTELLDIKTFTGMLKIKDLFSNSISYYHHINGNVERRSNDKGKASISACRTYWECDWYASTCQGIAYISWTSGWDTCPEPSEFLDGCGYYWEVWYQNGATPTEFCDSTEEPPPPPPPTGGEGDGGGTGEIRHIPNRTHVLG